MVVVARYRRCSVDFVSRLIAAVVLFVFTVTVNAQTICAEYNFSPTTLALPWAKSWGAAAAALDAKCMSIAGTDAESACFYGGISQIGRTLTSHVTIRGASQGSNYLASVNWCSTSNSGSSPPSCYTTGITAPSYRTDPEGCPQCQPAGTVSFAAAPPGGMLDSLADGSTGCMTDNCSWTASNERRTLVAPSMTLRRVVSTGNSCSAKPDSLPVPVTPTKPGDTCVVGNSGDVVCDSPDVGCGTYNGERICITAAAPGECRTTPSGGSICVTDAANPLSTPPAPDTGTPGQIADTSTSITIGDTTMNYYSSTVVAGSSATGSSPAGSTDGVTRGTGGTTGGGTGSTAGTTTDVNEGMEGAGLAPGDSVPESQINVGSLNPSQGVLVGSCPPALSLTVWDRPLTLDVFGPACSTLEQVRPVVLLVAWLSAAFILGGAFAVKV